jgi:ferrochelatase
MAGMVGVDDYALGFQNHENRDIPWTSPDVESAVEELDAERVVVEPVSFMHEQSETLSELDDELREEAEEAGMAFHRVPVPHDDERFPSVLADLVEPFLLGMEPEYYQFRQCQCRDEPGTYCLNAPR